mmetsp:Transcript_99257/g.320109  ORF Transcript_99257/g.320109 Transcript_99257/m.320109 type:complete len:1093 (+) Transcript_99257:49-3327(+)
MLGSAPLLPGAHGRLSRPSWAPHGRGSSATALPLLDSGVEVGQQHAQSAASSGGRDATVPCYLPAHGRSQPNARVVAALGLGPRQAALPAGEHGSRSTATGLRCAATGALAALLVVQQRTRLRRPLRQGHSTGAAAQGSMQSGCQSERGGPLAGATWLGHRHRQRSSVALRSKMFERFTERTIRAVVLAQEEAQRLGQDRVGTEMLVVGVIAEGSEIGSRVLRRLGVDINCARAELEKLLGRGVGSGKCAMDIPFTVASKQAIEDTVECARSLGSPAVDTSHLLLAVLQQENGNGSVLLGRLCKSRSAKVLKGELLRMLAVQHALERGEVRPGQSGAIGNETVEDAELATTLRFGKDLTLLARRAELDPLVGREEQLSRTIRILGRRSKNNPVLIGEAGVGKTSIAYGLAQRIADGDVPQMLRGRRVVQLDLAMLLAGTRYRGDFEERLKDVIREVCNSGRRVILVIDEVHMLVGAGGTGNSDGGVGIDAANLLKPALARGDLQCIGATTLDEYRKYIERDPALERRFQPVTVPEPSQDESLQILEGLAPKYEKHHQLRYTPEALAAAVKLASQYIADRYLPDKAIDVMDEAGSKVRQQIFQDVEDSEAAAERWAVSQEIEEVRAKKKEAAALERYDQAQQLKVREVELQERLQQLQEGKGGEGAATARLVEELRALKAQMHEAASAERFTEAHELKTREREVLSRLTAAGGDKQDKAAALVDRRVTEEDVAQVVAGWTGIAVEQVSATESARLLRLEDELHQSIVGQGEAVQSVSRALRRARAGLRNPERPIAGFMFCGPTGVGKTQLCKTLATTFFGTEESMIRLDMSEYMEKHTVSKLIGAPPGYVGYSDGGTLTEAVRRRPYSLVLFDEVEKAHPDVFNMMLQLLDDGRLTDSKGRTVSFANTLVVMTSNLGSRSVQKGAAGGMGMGFGTEEDADEQSYARMKDLVHEEMKSFFRPEFLNRLDEMVVFRALTREDVRAIAEVEFKKVLARLSETGLDVSLTPRFKERVVEEGFDPAYGARPLRRAITRMLEDTLAETLLSEAEHGEEAQAGEAGEAGPEQGARRAVEIDAQDGRVVVRKENGKVFAGV